MQHVGIYQDMSLCEMGKYGAYVDGTIKKSLKNVNKPMNEITLELFRTEGRSTRQKCIANTEYQSKYPKRKIRTIYLLQNT